MPNNRDTSFTLTDVSLGTSISIGTQDTPLYLYLTERSAVKIPLRSCRQYSKMLFHFWSLLRSSSACAAPLHVSLNPRKGRPLQLSSYYSLRASQKGSNRDSQQAPPSKTFLYLSKTSRLGIPKIQKPWHFSRA